MQGDEEGRRSNSVVPLSRRSELLRGRELVEGLEVPEMNRSDVAGREQELIGAWWTASQAERDQIDQMCAEADAFLAEHAGDLE